MPEQWKPIKRKKETVLDNAQVKSNVAMAESDDYRLRCFWHQPDFTSVTVMLLM